LKKFFFLSPSPYSLTFNMAGDVALQARGFAAHCAFPAAILTPEHHPRNCVIQSWNTQSRKCEKLSNTTTTTVTLNTKTTHKAKGFAAHCAFPPAAILTLEHHLSNYVIQSWKHTGTD
jgi:hypothetical protein